MPQAMGPGSGVNQGSWMMPGGMGSMMLGPVVGPDGTVYLLKTLVGLGPVGMMGGSAASAKTQLVAVAAGSVLWKFDLDGWMISRPVLTPDGNIVLAESFPADFAFGFFGVPPNAAAGRAKLVILSANGSAPQILAQTPVETDTLSAPVIVTASDGSYTILATGLNMTGMMGAFFNGTADTPQQTSLFTFDSMGNLQSKLNP